MLSELEKHIMNDEAVSVIVQKVNEYVGENRFNYSRRKRVNALLDYLGFDTIS